MSRARTERDREEMRARNRDAAARYRLRNPRPSRAKAPQPRDETIEWRQLPWLPGYEISERGDFYRTLRLPYHPPRLKRGFVNRGYRYFDAVVGGETRRLAAHRLVCEAWHGPPPFDGAEAAHRNGDRLYNCPENLRWSSSLENAADKQLHGTILKAETHPNRKLDWKTVREIRSNFTGQRGEIAAIARRLGLSNDAVRKVIRGERWREFSR